MKKKGIVLLIVIAMVLLGSMTTLAADGTILNSNVETKDAVVAPNYIPHDWQLRSIFYNEDGSVIEKWYVCIICGSIKVVHY